MFTCTQDVFTIVAVVMDGGGRSTVTLPAPQQSGSAPFLVKYPHLGKKKKKSIKNKHHFLFLYQEKFMFYLDGVVGSIRDQ